MEVAVRMEALNADGSEETVMMGTFNAAIFFVPVNSYFL